MAVLKFRIYWEEDDSVYRDIAIRHTQTFFDLHHAILVSYEFDKKHQATFYRSNDNWQKGREISLENYSERRYKVEPLIMAEVPIGNEIKNTNQKFIYEYDFVKGWSFLIELIQIEKSDNNKLEYPAVVRVIGFGPSQYGTKAMFEKKTEAQEERYDLEKDEMDEGYGTEGEEGDNGGEDDGGNEAGAEDDY